MNESVLHADELAILADCERGGDAKNLIVEYDEYEKQLMNEI